MGILSALFGQSKQQQQVKDMIANGGIIIDVRTPGEFQGGHIQNAKNVPLNTINSKKIKELKQLNKPLILCCASGMRSAQATNILKKEGIDAINGGGWRSLQ